MKGRHRREKEWVLKKGRYNRWGVFHAKSGLGPVYQMWVEKSQARRIAHELNSEKAEIG